MSIVRTSIQHDALYHSYDELLAELRGEKVLFEPNPGNAGDGLIAYATLAFLNDHGIDFEIIRSTTKLEDRVVLFGGGGGLTSHYDHAVTFLQRLHERCGKLIILPHSISGHQDLLESLGSNTTIYCREEVSYAYVKSLDLSATTRLAHDLVFYLNQRGHPSGIPWTAHLTTRDARLVWKAYGANTLEYVRAIISTSSQRRDVLNAFRTDAEMTTVPFEGNIDVSNLFVETTSSPASSIYGAKLFLDLLGRYKRIRTNRLHVCIAGAILGKEVDFYPNSYWKNEAVYDHSIRKVFPNVNWHFDHMQAA